MSRVTNLILHIGLFDGNNEKGNIVEVNRYFEATGGLGLVSLDDPFLPKSWYGGTKNLEANLYAGAFNGLFLEKFLGHLRGLKWKQPERVQLLVKEQDDERFRLINVFD